MYLTLSSKIFILSKKLAVKSLKTIISPPFVACAQRKHLTLWLGFFSKLRWAWEWPSDLAIKASKYNRSYLCMLVTESYH